MIIDSFAASADLIGRRVLLRWAFVPAAGETTADWPSVVIRRKRRDFEFPPPTSRDPYLVYDSATFPPVPSATLAVADLPDRDRTDGAVRIREQTVTVAELTAAGPREVLRRTERTVFAADRVMLRREVELLDVGGPGGDLEPGVPYYYQLDSPALPDGPERDRFRITATPGEVHGNHRTLYELIPEVYRRHDTVTRLPDAGTGLLPEANTAGGQLRRFMDTFGAAVDAMLSSADGLRSLRSASDVDSKFLPLLARWIGWDLTIEGDVARQRNEITTAPRLYGAVGSIPGLRSVVDHYTGWSTRVAEFAQHIVRTNAAPQRNLFASVRRDGTWWGADDAAPVLGFAAPGDVAVGTDTTAAALTGSVAEPFALRPGMSVTVAADGGLPATVTFGTADFADIGRASAGEVAVVVNRVAGVVVADVAGGAVRLSSPLQGKDSRVEVAASEASLVSLDGAPRGRLATVVDAAERLWVAHATTVGPGEILPRLRVKAYLRGRWQDTRPVEARPVAPQADPAVVALPGGDLWLAWVENPGTDRAELRWRTGVPKPLAPAQLRGEFGGPFALVVGTRLALTGYGRAETFLVRAADYATLADATGQEVAQAVNAQLTGVGATTAPDGSLVLRTTAAGPGVALRVDLPASSAARVLGFGDRGLLGSGGWDAEVAWGPSAPVTSVPVGRHADCTAAVDPSGAVRLVWTTHAGGSWRLTRARWDGRLLVPTATGLGVLAPDGTWSALTTGLPATDVRGVAVDADGSTWYATAAGAALRRPDGAITALTRASTSNGLASDDVRAVAVAPDGTVWFAHPTGASARLPNGTWRTETANLASPDVRHVAVDSHGAVWFATAAGVSRLAAGAWTTLTTAGSRHVAPAADGVWVATSAGLTRIDGQVTAIGLAALGLGAAADDVRAVAVDPTRDDTVWAATAAGVVELRSARTAHLYSTADGLPSADITAVTVTPDGVVWAGTTAGLGRRGSEGWRRLTTADGLPGNTVRSLHGPWSAPMRFALDGVSERDPHVLRDGDRLWLAWSQVQAAGDETDRRRLRLRRFDWPAPAWSEPVDVTDGATDAEPAITPLPGGGTRVYFRSNRGGGLGMYTVDVSGADAAPVVTLVGPAADTSPAPVVLPDGVELLLFRSDRNVALGRLGGGIPGETGADDSRRAPEEAAIRRFAGSVTAAPADLDRNRGRGHFGDLLDYTPQQPDGGPLAPDELYTPGTIGLYVERGPTGRPLVRRDADRLKQLLQRFLPVNLRAVVVLRSGELDEVIPPPTDAYRDKFPLAERYQGLTDETAVVPRGWLVFLSTDAESTTADPTHLTTPRRRSWWPPFR
ncbi:hypothetical protein [Actinophytocola sp.]|uniref:hypothetical protein n=1 Tax=Actinophytocola sp. TaxID=1872138 RepID=UPI003899CDD4